MKLIRFTILIILAFIVVSHNYATKLTDIENNYLSKVINDACPSEGSIKFKAKIARMLKKIKARDNWERAFTSSLYSACFLEYSSWRSSMAFTLGYVGQLKGLKQKTISLLTELLSSYTIGRKTYLRYGKSLENFQLTGLDDGRVRQIINAARLHRYRSKVIDVLGFVYIELRKGGLSHIKALENSLSMGKKFSSKKKCRKSYRRSPTRISKLF